MSVATATELWRLSATDLAQAIRSRQVSSHEVIQAHLRRIEAVNPAVNAVTVVLGEQALEAAKAADRAVADGGDLPRLHGVPFTVKGNIDLVGTPTTQGAKALVGAYPTLDAPVVERLKAAGAIPIGHTNLPTFALRWHTDSELYGPTINPWDRSRTAGASSAGEAAAIATGMSPLGLGNDGLGSLRHPAQCCGVGALKPTLGRIPDATTTGPADAPIGFQLADVQGPLARRVVDQGCPGGPSRSHLARPLVGAGAAARPRTRQAHPGGPGGRPGRPGHRHPGPGRGWQGGHGAGRRRLCRRGSRAAVDRPGGQDPAGHAQHPRHPGDVAAGVADDAARHQAVPVRVLRGGRGSGPGDDHPESFATRQSLLRAWGQFQQQHPLIVAPICTDIPLQAGTDLDEGRVADTIHGMRMAMAVNALGMPAVAVPVGVGDGLPQAVQVIGPRYREDLCLDAAATIEDRVGILTPIDPRWR
jgi:amidase